MPVVLVHGNPESKDIWDPLLEVLGRTDVTTLSPPGFGAPVPEGFGATSDDYLDWLIGEVTRMEPPVDLVGHDWGGGHVLRLACARPDLIRSWTSDIAGCFDSDYVWHDMAQTWQTPGAGEKAVAKMVAVPRILRVEYFHSLGMTRAVARKVVKAQTADMGRCILALYRSARQPRMQRFGADLPKAASRPGLVLIPARDRYTGTVAMARRAARQAEARTTVLRGQGHWWMCEDPRPGADALNAFLSDLDA